jgi:hypothetical protein
MRPWEQVSGRFYGGGTAGFSDTANQPSELSLSIVFVDQPLEQIANVRESSDKEERTGNVLKRSDTSASRADFDGAKLLCDLVEVYPGMQEKP